MALLAAVAVAIDRGVPNALDRLALALHRFAVRARARQTAIAAQLEREWRAEI